MDDELDRKPLRVARSQDAESLTAEGWSAFITDVDCTPRPRYRETPEAFAARMGEYQRDAQVLERQVARDNRMAAVRLVTALDGTEKHVAGCVCGWHGLQQLDPEVARREYDVHACTVTDGNEIHRVYNGRNKRPASTMVPALLEERLKTGRTLPGDVEQAVTKVDAAVQTLEEATEQWARAIEVKR